MNRIGLFIVSTSFTIFGFNGCAQKELEVKKVNDCPILNKKNETIEQKDYAKGFIDGLNRSMPSIAKVYTDVLKQYNQINEPVDFINKKSLQELGSTEIFGSLIASYYLSTNVGINHDKQNAIKMDKLYTDLLATIDSSNPEWCKLSNYNNLLEQLNDENFSN